VENVFLDEIFDSISVSNSMEALFLKKKINLKDFNSLRFIQKNSSLKSLVFSGIYFSQLEMETLNDSLKNSSLTSLNLSNGNFQGPFGFLGNDNLREFTFQSIPEAFNVKDFFQHLKINKSLRKLYLSLKYIVKEIQYDFEELFDIMSSHKTLKSLTIDYFDQLNVSGFHKLLKNPNLKELHLTQCFSKLNQFENLMKELNNNESLTILDVSLNRKQISWNDSKIRNKTLVKFDMEGNEFDFSKNMNLLRELLEIPTLNELRISENKLGSNGVKFLCDFLETTISKLCFSGK
jgi:hypothetical protein